MFSLLKISFTSHYHGTINDLLQKKKFLMKPSFVSFVFIFLRETARTTLVARVKKKTAEHVGYAMSVLKRKFARKSSSAFGIASACDPAIHNFNFNCILYTRRLSPCVRVQVGHRMKGIMIINMEWVFLYMIEIDCVVCYKLEFIELLTKG